MRSLQVSRGYKEDIMMTIFDIINMLYDEHPDWTEDQIIETAYVLINE